MTREERRARNRDISPRSDTAGTKTPICTLFMRYKRSANLLCVMLIEGERLHCQLILRPAYLKAAGMTETIGNKRGAVAARVEGLLSP
jgi:hypothetical protein